jgi:hypothetical protein
VLRGTRSSGGRPRGRPARSLAAAALVAVLASATLALANEGGPGAEPTISGEARVGETLTSSEASLYKWQRCDPAAHACGDGQGNHAIGWEDIEGSQGQNARTYTVATSDLGLLIRVLAKQTSTGTQYSPSAPVGPVLPARGTEPPGEPDPIFNETANLDPVEGLVWVRPPGSRRSEPIEELTQVPIGSEIDVTDGKVKLITQVRPSGGGQSIELWAGAFTLAQRKQRAITELRLRSPFAGPPQAAGRVALRRKGRGKLWGRGKCRCRTKGKRSSGTARGTWWLTAERRNGTLTKVRKGKVLVKDNVRKRKVLVKAGQKYLARRR